MRKCFFPPNEAFYRSENLPLSHTSSYCEGALPDNFLFYYRRQIGSEPIPPFAIGKDYSDPYSFSYRWWIEGPTASPGYYPVMIKETTYDSWCSGRNLAGGNSLVDTNQFFWACLTSQPPKIVPGQVFEVILDEYTEMTLQMEDVRSNRIPESVTLVGEPVIYDLHGLRYRYNKKPEGLSLIEPISYQPSDGLAGDLPIVYGRPKKLGSITFTANAYNLYGSTSETFVVNVRNRGLTISLQNWSANWTSWRDIPAPPRSLELIGRGLTAPVTMSITDVSISPLTPEQTYPGQIITGWQTALPLPGTTEPDTADWSTQTRVLPLTAEGAIDQLIFVRPNPFYGTWPLAKFTALVNFTGLLKFDQGAYSKSQVLESIVRPGVETLLGNDLFTVVFPLYCRVATSGNKTVGRYYLDPDGFTYVSINGGNPTFLDPATPPQLALTAGWNRVVFVYTTTAQPTAALVIDQVTGVEAWKSPASLLSCAGKKVKECIPAVTSDLGLVDDISGIVYINISDSLKTPNNGFPYVPVNRHEFPVEQIPAGWSREVEFIVQLHSNKAAYEKALLEQALPESAYKVVNVGGLG